MKIDIDEVKRKTLVRPTGNKHVDSEEWGWGVYLAIHVHSRVAHENSILSAPLIKSV